MYKKWGFDGGFPQKIHNFVKINKNCPLTLCQKNRVLTGVILKKGKKIKP